jgi:hypothetical protein
MIIQVMKNKKVDTYTVRVGKDLYEMSENANQPNGVCTYIGEYDEYDEFTKYPPPLDTVPIGIVWQIAYIVEDYTAKYAGDYTAKYADKITSGSKS